MSAWIRILKLWKWPWRTENPYNWKHWVFEEITFGILFCRTAYLWIHYLWMLNQRWNLRKGKLVSLKDYKCFCEWCFYTLIHYSKYKHLQTTQVFFFFIVAFSCHKFIEYLLLLLVLLLKTLIPFFLYLCVWPGPPPPTHFGRLNLCSWYSEIF